MPILYTDQLHNQPPQAVPTKDKDTTWLEANMDWLQQLCHSNLPEKRRKLQKNYNLSMGVIDIEDYVTVDTSDYKSVYDTVEEALQEELFKDTDIVPEDLHYYPIVPSIINVLAGELAEKFDHIKVKGIDDVSTNEFFEHKKSLMIDYFRTKAQEKIMGQIDQSQLENPEEIQKIIEEEEQKVLSLPHIQRYLERNYQSNYEKWASKVMEEINLKFNFLEKEVESFKHQLTADEAYWHTRLLEEDIDIELWNPMEVVVIKPSHIKYTTEADTVVRQYQTTLNDVISRFRNKIPEEYADAYTGSLSVVPYLERDKHRPGDEFSNYRAEKKLAYFKYILNNQEINPNTRVEVTEGYWVSQRRLAKVKSVYDGQQNEKIVDPHIYKVVYKPEYNEKKELIYGEEIEYFYAPEVYYGVKLDFGYGATLSASGDINDDLHKEIFGGKKKKESDNLKKGVLYIDVAPIEYQFTDKYNPFKPIIPVAGCDGFEPQMNVGKLSLVDKTKAYQILFNNAMNQIDMFMRNEIGLFYLLDQKLIPRNSLDGSWGKNNWLKFILTAKDTQLGVIDASLSNTEGGQSFNQGTVVNLLKNEQFASRLELANAFKNMLFESVGITPQRLGMVSSQETATGTEVSVANSFAQTKGYFDNHVNLMMVVKELALDAMKYIESKKPESRVNYINSQGDQVLFEIDTDDLLLRRYNVYLISTPNYSKIIDEFKQLAINNNTTGASILDLFTIIESNDARTIKDTLAQSMKKLEEQQERQRQHEQEMVDKEIQAAQQEKEAQRQFDADQNERDRLKDMYIAEVRAIGFSNEPDIDKSGINDALEVAKFNEEQDKNYSEMIDRQIQTSVKEREVEQKKDIAEKEYRLKSAEIATKERIERLKIQRDYANMRNDEQVERLRIKNSKAKKGKE